MSQGTRQGRRLSFTNLRSEGRHKRRITKQEGAKCYCSVGQMCLPRAGRMGARQQLGLRRQASRPPTEQKRRQAKRTGVICAPKPLAHSRGAPQRLPPHSYSRKPLNRRKRKKEIPLRSVHCACQPPPLTAATACDVGPSAALPPSRQLRRDFLKTMRNVELGESCFSLIGMSQLLRLPGAALLRHNKPTGLFRWQLPPEPPRTIQTLTLPQLLFLSLPPPSLPGAWQDRLPATARHRGAK